MSSEFDRLMGLLDYPLYIVTAADGQERAGCLIGFASQVSIHPPRFLACLSIKNRTYQVASRAEVLAVHVVPEEAAGLAELFGGETGDQVDKFAQVSWRPGPAGTPVLEELEDWFAGRVLERVDFGDHCGFVLEPLASEASEPVSSLTFHQAKDIDPGHEP